MFIVSIGTRIIANSILSSDKYVSIAFDLILFKRFTFIKINHPCIVSSILSDLK